MWRGISVAFVQQNDSEIKQILGPPQILKMSMFFLFGLMLNCLVVLVDKVEDFVLLMTLVSFMFLF